MKRLTSHMIHMMKTILFFHHKYLVVLFSLVKTTCQKYHIEFTDAP
jgi:hypothetical protein